MLLALHVNPQPAHLTRYSVHLILVGHWVNNLSLSNKQIICFVFALLQKDIKQKAQEEINLEEKKGEKISICKFKLVYTEEPGM